MYFILHLKCVSPKHISYEKPSDQLNRSKKENFRGNAMEKILKIIAMVLIVAAVVFAAGCAEKTDNAENQTQTPSEEVKSTPTETPVSSETPAEPSAPTVTPGATKENVTEAATGNVTGNVTENVTKNATVQAGTHMSNKQRKLAIAMNHTQSSGTVAVNDSQ
jgi:inhibitor of cysteine peptidase